MPLAKVASRLCCRHATQVTIDLLLFRLPRGVASTALLAG